MLKVAQRTGSKAGLRRLPRPALCCLRRSRPRPRQEAPAGGVAQLRPDFVLHAGQRRSAACRRVRQARSLSLTDFKFTPAAAKGRPSQVRVAIRARDAPSGTCRREVSAAPHRRSARWPRRAIISASRSAGGGSPSPATSPRPRTPTRRSAAAKPRSSASATRSSALPAASRSAPSAATATRCRRCASGDNYSLDVGGVLLAVAAHRADRRRPLQDRARPRCRRSRTTAATARRSTSAPPSSSELCLSSESRAWRRCSALPIAAP